MIKIFKEDRYGPETNFQEIVNKFLREIGNHEIHITMSANGYLTIVVSYDG